MAADHPRRFKLDAFFTYICYLVILTVGYVNDFIRPETSREKHRSVSIYNTLPISLLGIDKKC